MKSKRILILRIAIIVICLLWQSVIYGFSAENSGVSGGRSRGICESFAELLLRGREGVTDEDITALAERIEPPLRSLAHMFCFAILGGLYFLMLASFGITGMSRGALSVGCAFLYAVFDEMHQYFVPGRSMQLGDIAVDTVGALLAVSVLSLIFRYAQKKENKK